jgi:hypothetical protein
MFMLTESRFLMSRQAMRLWWIALACAAMGCETPTARVERSTAALQAQINLPWDTAVGRTIGDESASEGPESFALEPDGGYLVLDQVNRRVLHLDAEGRVSDTIELSASTFEDVEQFEGRAVLVLDRLVGRMLRVMDRQGQLIVDVPIEGSGIEHGGSITAMLPRPDGVWLEVDHRHSVKVLDRELRPCQRQVILGRPIVNGQSLRGELDGNGGVLISLGGRTEREVSQMVSLEGEAPIERIVWLDADSRGRVHVVLHEVRRSNESPYRVESEQYLMVLLDGQLRELERRPSPWVRTEYDQQTEFRLGPDGNLRQMAFTPEGVLLVDWGRRQP